MTDRIAALQSAVADAGAALAVVAAGSNLRHLVGRDVIALERLTALLVTPERVAMILPAFDQEEFREQTGIDGVFGWADADGPTAAVDAALWHVDAAAGDVLVDPELPFGFYAGMRDHFQGEARPARELLSALRMVKDEQELALIARAGDVVTTGMEEGLRRARAGMTEVGLRELIADMLRTAGADSAEYILVQAGAASATAHHEPDDTKLREGEPVLIDIATPTAGYWADMTQNVFLGEPDEEYARAYEVVLAAEDAGVRAARPGATAADVKRATQAVIEEAGYGEYAGGRVGHGIGLDVHEPPSIIEGDDTELRPGAVITVEPGIYIPGRWGIRIEDTIAVTDGEPRRLTQAPRPLATT